MKESPHFDHYKLCLYLILCEDAYKEICDKNISSRQLQSARIAITIINIKQCENEKLLKATFYFIFDNPVKKYSYSWGKELAEVTEIPENSMEYISDDDELYEICNNKEMPMKILYSFE